MEESEKHRAIEFFGGGARGGRVTREMRLNRMLDEMALERLYRELAIRPLPERVAFQIVAVEPLWGDPDDCVLPAPQDVRNTNRRG